MENLKIKAKMAFQAQIFHFFNAFSSGLEYLTILKTGKNQKYKFSTESFNLYAPKCPNVS